MRLDRVQEALFCAIANDENRTPHLCLVGIIQISGSLNLKKT